MPLRPSTTAPSLVGAHEHEADAGVRRSASMSPGYRSSMRSSVTRPGSRGKRDQAEAARRHHRHLGRPSAPFFSRRLRFRPDSSRRAGRLPPPRVELVAAGRLTVPSTGRGRSLGRGGVQVAPALVAPPGRATSSAPHLLGDEVLERLAEALLERRALRLAVVGRARRGGTGAGRVLGARWRAARTALSILVELPSVSGRSMPE